jgi:phosphoadenosine phosphosulfate reductase
VRSVEGALDVEACSAELEQRTPEERLVFAFDTWGTNLLFTSSFGAGSGVLLHLWSRVAPGLPVVFIDTGFHFAETLAYRDALVGRLGLALRVVRPEVPRELFLEEHGADVMKRAPDFCCARNKVAPVAPLLATASAWVSGLRRDHSAARSGTPILQRTAEGPIKVHPLASMTASEATTYMAEHDIPDHPLRGRRYLSIGCQPCTRAVDDGEDERAGRWAGTEKTECGLHTHVRPS